MLSEKIFGVRARLNELAGKVPSEVWEVLRAAGLELRDAQRQAANLEKNLNVPQARA